MGGPLAKFNLSFIALFIFTREIELQNQVSGQRIAGFIAIHILQDEIGLCGQEASKRIILDIMPPKHFIQKSGGP